MNLQLLLFGGSTLTVIAMVVIAYIKGGRDKEKDISNKGLKDVVGHYEKNG